MDKDDFEKNKDELKYLIDGKINLFNFSRMQ